MKFDKLHELDHELDLDSCFITYASPTFVYWPPLPKSEYGRDSLRSSLMRAMRSGATEIRVSGRPKGLGRIVTIIPELQPDEVISPSVPELMQHLETIKGQTILLNLDELIEEFLREAHPDNQLAEQYIANLRSAPMKNFEMYVESADVEEGQAVIRLKPTA